MNLPLMLFLFYGLACINKLSTLFNVVGIKAILVSILLMWLVFLISSIINFNTFYFNIVRSFLIRLLFSYFFFIIIYNELFKDTRVKLLAQNTVIFSIIVMSGFYVTGIGVEFINGRLFIFETNANLIGVWASTAILFSVDLIIITKPKGLRLWYYFSAIALALLLIILSGSRKAVIIMPVGVLVYYLFLNRSFQFKVRLLVPLTVFAVIAFYSIAGSDLIASRFESEMERRDLGGRMPIWEAGMEIARLNPFFGVGIGEFAFQMESRLGQVRALHNEFIQILGYGGIAGLFCFSVFLTALLLKSISALKNKYTDFTSLPLALFIMILFYLFSAGGALTSFYAWFIFAFISAKASANPYKEATISPIMN
mgnify:CR=1 FL=1